MQWAFVLLLCSPIAYCASPKIIDNTEDFKEVTFVTREHLIVYESDPIIWVWNFPKEQLEQIDLNWLEYTYRENDERLSALKILPMGSQLTVNRVFTYKEPFEVYIDNSPVTWVFLEDQAGESYVAHWYHIRQTIKNFQRSDRKIELQKHFDYCVKSFPDLCYITLEPYKSKRTLDKRFPYPTLFAKPFTMDDDDNVQGQVELFTRSYVTDDAENDIEHHHHYNIPAVYSVSKQQITLQLSLPEFAMYFGTPWAENFSNYRKLVDINPKHKEILSKHKKSGSRLFEKDTNIRILDKSGK